MERLRNGDIVRHFKREAYLKKYDVLKEKIKLSAYRNDKTYMYRIIDINATHTETKERLVVYQALYASSYVQCRQVFVRPYDMFMSEVDHDKYPDVEQKYRFEMVCGVR